MRQKRCKVGAAILAHDYGKTLTVGQVVDLDERLPSGGVLADLVRLEWFEDLAPVPPEAETPRRRRGVVMDEATVTPATPAAEE